MFMVDVVGSGQVVMRRLVRRGPLDPGALACGWTQHASGDRAAHGEQHRKQYQQPKTNGSHGEVTLAWRHGPPL